MSKAMEALKKAAENAKKSKFTERDEDYFYYPVRDDAGNGSATIRFLPGLPTGVVDEDGYEELHPPFVKILKHHYKNDERNKWVIAECPKTIGEPCPICEANTAMYNIGTKEAKDLYTKYKGKTSFVSRILIIEDKKTPENVGKVFKYRYGIQIFKKIEELLMPEFLDEDEKEEFIEKWGSEEYNPFDIKTGANFKLKIRKVEGQTTYDKSGFDKPSDCKFKGEYPSDTDLEAFVSPTRFLSYDALEEKLAKSNGTSVTKKPYKKVDEKVGNNLDDLPDEASVTKPEKVNVGLEEDDELDALLKSLDE